MYQPKFEQERVASNYETQAAASHRNVMGDPAVQFNLGGDKEDIKYWSLSRVPGFLT
ncbi:hypothetical protein FVEN_g12799 [Fusarium venenatum]|nr:hypothetical protein FVEN_g12799 [Fusarium venenatum]